YVTEIVRFRDGVWPPNQPFFTVSEQWMRQCPAPLLVLPGSDEFHPTGIAERICQIAPRARCLDVDCRSPSKLAATAAAICAFLTAHVPAWRQQRGRVGKGSSSNPGPPPVRALDLCSNPQRRQLFARHLALVPRRLLPADDD